MSKKKKYIIAVIAGILLVVLVVLAVTSLKKNSERSAVNTEAYDSSHDSASETMIGDTRNLTGGAIDGAQPESFDEGMDETGDTAETAETVEETVPAPEVYTEGTEHASVADIQQRLMDLGFMENDEPTQYYGTVTSSAVKLFQRQNNLTQDGVLGPETKAMIFTEDCKGYAAYSGMEGDDINRIQNRMYELGYFSDSSSVSGKYDEQTEMAVRKLQETNQLTVDGKVGRETTNLLYSDAVKPNLLSYGEQSEVVKTYQNRLKELGYLTTQPDGTYGDDTVRAIKQFQSRNDLVMDGYLGPTTRQVMQSSEARVNGIELGEEGETVSRVQELLSKLGYLNSANVTGYYGEITQKAVKQFQQSNKLMVDGAVGVQTMTALTGDKAVKYTGKAASGTDQKSDSAGSAGTGSGALSGSVQALISKAASKVGSPYVWGAKGPNKFDCSGFVYWCLNQIGVKQSYLTSAGWRNIGKYKRISNYSDVCPGDIIVEKGHMGIVAEDGKVIDASSGNGKVVYRKRTDWWRQNFIVAWRIF